MLLSGIHHYEEGCKILSSQDCSFFFCSMLQKRGKNYTFCSKIKHFAFKWDIWLWGKIAGLQQTVGTSELSALLGLNLFLWSSLCSELSHSIDIAFRELFLCLRTSTFLIHSINVTFSMKPSRVIIITQLRANDYCVKCHLFTTCFIFLILFSFFHRNGFREGIRQTQTKKQRKIAAAASKKAAASAK